MIHLERFFFHFVKSSPRSDPGIHNDWIQKLNKVPSMFTALPFNMFQKLVISY